MKDKFIELAPAKINLFLKILNKRTDNYHNIRSGITFINLFDEITVEKSSFFKIYYIGKFAPANNFYTDCILERLFETFRISKPRLNFIVEKNIPVQSGLGSASSNAAAMFRILEKMNIYKINNMKETRILGADIPLFLNQKDCLIRGTGEKITNKMYPKYYFLLVKPSSNCSTKEMYNLIKSNDLDYNIANDYEEINEFDIGNDFEKIITRTNEEITQILNFFKDLEYVIFSRMTGTGSCCYAAFDKKKDAENAQKKFVKKFPLLWTLITENNAINR